MKMPLFELLSRRNNEWGGMPLVFRNVDKNIAVSGGVRKIGRLMVFIEIKDMIRCIVLRNKIQNIADIRKARYWVAVVNRGIDINVRVEILSKSEVTNFRRSKTVHRLNLIPFCT